MSSDPFDLLGIDRATATDADVRRAYAERLKITRPEDDREGFMALRAAFEAARNAVRWRDEYDGYEQDHSPPDEYGQSSAEAAARAQESEPSHADIQPYEEDVPSESGDPHEDESDGSDEDDGFTREEIDAWLPVKAALDRLADVLTATGRPPPVKAVLDVIDHDDVSGIDQYQTMQQQVRQLICQRTNYFDENRVMRLPDWLSLEVFDAMETYYGWSRETSTSSYVKGMNDWMMQVRRAIELDAAPVRARNQAVLDDVTAGLFGKKDAPAEAERSGKGSAIWLWIGAGILISQLVQFLARINGGG